MNEDRLREQHIQETLLKLAQMENIVGQPLYDLQNNAQLQINIRVSKDVPAGKFKPDPLVPGGWLATELTFRAMKKDIFAQQFETDTPKISYTCTSCKNTLEVEFWHFCPFCGAKFEN